MSVDFEVIAKRGQCDVSSLRLALPLLEQGFSPPFLSRYRRDELGGIDESSLWALSAAVRNEEEIAARKEKLHAAWQETSLGDPAIGYAIKKAGSIRVLARLARRLKGESSTSPSDSARLAVRVLNPQKGDGDDFAAIAGKIESIADADAAVAGLDEALAHRLPDDPRIIAAAVRWLAKHAQIKIAKIHDPHVESAAAAKTDETATADEKKPDAKSEATPPANPETPPAESAPEVTADASAAAEVATETPAEVATETPTVAATETPAEPGTETPAEASTETPTEPATETPAEASTETPTAADPAVNEKTEKPVTEQPVKEKKSKKKPEAKKSSKKISPRQRRRRWLVSVLKPLQGKKFGGDKLSAFQVVMLGRALRSQVAVCQFEYDAAKLVAELERTAVGINRAAEEKMKQIVLQNEAVIREAAESAWWDDLQERASSRLVSVTADTLRQHVNRGAVDAKVVLAIDAVGPRTAATTIVSADGRLLHCEDLPCQLSAAQRSTTVARMGELIHSHHVDLIVISNGPARRSIMVAVGDLIKQSPEKSVRWTLAERGGADAYSSSSVADQEMRSTPRRFRSAAWLAMSVLQPAQAMAKVDPLKLRLSSFQRELSEEALAPVLENILVSGASRGGVDVNSAPQSWLARLPGMTQGIASAIDTARRKSLFQSRQAILEVEGWTSEAEGRQALPFLRVFGSQETLDGTLIHPNDYPLAQKLAKTLGIESPPPKPPGYEPPDYSAASSAAASEIRPIEVVQKEEKAIVEEFTTSGEKASDFSVDVDTDVPAEATTTAELAATETQNEVATAETTPPEPTDAPEQAPAETVAEETVPSETVPSESDAEESSEPNEQASADTQTPVTESVVSPVAEEPIKHPLPEKSAIDKCIKEWQIGRQRAYQIVHWLCDPFGDSDSSGTPPAVLTKVPSMKDLSPGDQVIGVVVGVMPFGVFVELAPDCSGLIHVSRVSDAFVEDLHEAVQVGDVVTAWVTGIDEKKRRVGLSALSPEREAEIQRTRQNQRGGRGRGGSGPGRSGGPGRATGQGQGVQGRGVQGRGRQGQGGQGQGGQERSGKAQSGQGRGGRPDGKHGGGGRDGNRGRGRDHRGGKGREKRVESYRVVAKKEDKPISEKMAKGEEPLRSFGDLAQFMGTSKPTAPKKEIKPKPKQPKPESSETKSEEQSVASEPTKVDSGNSATVNNATGNGDPGAAAMEPQSTTTPTPETSASQSPDAETTAPSPTEGADSSEGVGKS